MSEQELKLWLEVAKHDSETARLIIQNDGYPDIGIYHVHQAVEKLLKALFINNHVIPPKVHFLDQLFRQLEAMYPSISIELQNILLIDKYLPKLRYPSSDLLSKDELIDCFEAFQSIRNTVFSIVYDNVRNLKKRESHRKLLHNRQKTKEENDGSGK